MIIRRLAANLAIFRRDKTTYCRCIGFRTFIYVVYYYYTTQKGEKTKRRDYITVYITRVSYTYIYTYLGVGRQ